jgi:hypothetical protein
LTASSKIKTKLLNPIGVAEGMLIDCQKEIKQRIDELEVDVVTLRLLNSQTAAWEKELKSEVMDQCQQDVMTFFIRRSEIVDTLISQLSFIDRIKMGLGLGHDAFDDAWEDSLRQSQSLILGKQSEFSHHRHCGIEQGLLTIVGECAQSITNRCKSQGQISIEYLGKRHSIVGVGRITAPKFERLQEDLNQSFANAIQNCLARLPSDDECASRMYTLLGRSSLISATFFVSSAIGPVAMMTEVVDITAAIALSSSLVMLGGISIPLGNRYASQSCKKEWMSFAGKLDASLDVLFQEVLRRVSAQLAESVAPYSRFVNGEGDHLKDIQSRIDSGLSNANALRGQINKACDL